MNFLPILYPFKINKLALENVTPAFINNLDIQLATKNFSQYTSIGIIEAKFISFSLAIQEIIFNIVKNENNYNILSSLEKKLLL